MFYAEGNWDAHLDAFRELPDRSIVFHIDRGTPLLTHRKLHDKFALSGGVTNVTLAMGTPEQVRAEVRTLIETIGRDGGYIMDASAIMQNDTRPENMRALVEATREFGSYDDPDVLPEPLRVAPATITPERRRPGDERAPARRVRLVGGAPCRAGGAHRGERGAGPARLGGGRLRAARPSSGRCWSRSDAERPVARMGSRGRGSVPAAAAQ